jgi:zinc protease
MKNLLVIASIFLIRFPIFAQSGTSSSFTVNDIKVIYKQTNKEIINISIYFRGGVSNYDSSQAGIEKMAATGVIDCGNTKYRSEEFKNNTDVFGIDISANTGLDDSHISLNCLHKYFNEGWDLFTEAVLHPLFNNADFVQLREKIISAEKQQMANPDYHIKTLAIQQAFKGSSYEINPDGTEETLSRLSRDEVKDFYFKKLLAKSRIFIVVVGNLPEQTIRERISAAFINIPSGDYKAIIPEVPPFPKNNITIEEHPIATNYIIGIVNAPLFISPDYTPFRLAFSELSGSIYSELRINRGIAYSPGAHVNALLLPLAYLHVNTISPKDAVNGVLTALHKEENSSIAKKSLEQIQALFITRNYLDEESSFAIADDLGRCEVLGDWTLAERLPNLVKSVTRNQMSDAFKKYVGHIQWAYLGNLDKARESMDLFTADFK